MNYNRFISNQGWISFSYPSNLINIEEEEGTYLFYTEQTGSFRITPLRLMGKGDFDADNYLNSESKNNEGEILQNPFNKYVHYVSRSVDNIEDLTIFNWIFARNDKIVYCSYTIETDSIRNPEIVEEHKEIIKIIESINVS